MRISDCSEPEARWGGGRRSIEVGRGEFGVGEQRMPARDLLALGAEGFGLSPVIAFADIPGVDFDDQREGLGRGPLAGLGEALQAFPGVELAQVGSAGGWSSESLAPSLDFGGGELPLEDAGGLGGGGGRAASLQDLVAQLLVCAGLGRPRSAQLHRRPGGVWACRDGGRRAHG